MEKRELIFEIISRLLEIEETSLKGVDFSYNNNTGISFHFRIRPGAGHEWIGSFNSIYLAKDFDNSLQIERAFSILEQVKNTSDVEPKHTFSLPESKARELGLL